MGWARKVIKAGVGRESARFARVFAGSPLSSAPDKTVVLRRLSSESLAMSGRVKLCQFIFKKEERLIGAGREKIRITFLSPFLMLQETSGSLLLRNWVLLHKKFVFSINAH